MLSYRHAFHAGNYADALKHLVLCKTLEYLLQKPAPIVYIDTHAGAGSYSLKSQLAKKTEEYKSGVGALDFSQLPESIQVYRDIVLPMYDRRQYPGSPLIAANMLREQDKLRLYEMHTTDYPLLKDLFAADRRAIANNTDGFHALKALLPTKNARAVVLIDPSYEIKNDYQLVVEAIQQGHRRMSTAHFLLWYPIVDRKRVEKMLKNICDSGIRNIWRFELAIAEDNPDYGMTGSGMLVINPPWVLAEQMSELLPPLSRQLITESGYTKVEQLVAE